MRKIPKVFFANALSHCLSASPFLFHFLLVSTACLLVRLFDVLAMTSLHRRQSGVHLSAIVRFYWRFRFYALNFSRYVCLWESKCKLIIWDEKLNFSIKFIRSFSSTSRLYLLGGFTFTLASQCERSCMEHGHNMLATVELSSCDWLFK